MPQYSISFVFALTLKTAEFLSAQTLICFRLITFDFPFLDLDRLNDLDDIDQVQILPNTMENIIMSNIDRTLHGDCDVKTAVLNKTDVNILNAVGVAIASAKGDPVLNSTKLRLLQESTMIESALDLDTLEEQSVVSVNSGNSSQTGLLKSNSAPLYK